MATVLIRAFLLSFAAIFFSTRVGILAHEYLGHGMVAWLLGGEIIASRIFFFHGGWVLYEGVPQHLNWIVLYSGSGASCLLALVLIWVSRSTRGWSHGILMVVGCGSFFQNAIYFFRGLHFGYGDGYILFRQLGETKDWLTLGTLPVLGYLAWRWTPQLFGVASCYVPSPSKKMLFWPLALMFPLASLSFAILGEAEIRLRDPSFYSGMRPLEERVVDQTLEELDDERRNKGEAPLSEEERTAVRDSVGDEHGELPYDFLAGLCLVIGCLWGVKDYQHIPRLS